MAGSTLNLLRDITAFVKATKEPSSADRPVRLAVVDATYMTGWPKVTFEGESTLSGKQYPHVDSYSPAPGDRVVLVPVGTTYLIVGAVSSTGAGLPAGAIQPYAGAAAPAGWLACDGTAVSRSTYSRLFAAIGTTWGAGNGSTTFNVPDLRGRAPIGAGTGAGLTARALAGSGGAETVTLTTATMPAHGHSFSGGSAASSGDHGHASSGDHGHGSSGDHSHSLSGSTGSDGDHSHSVGNQSTRSDILAGGGTTTAATGGGSTGSDGSHSHSLSGSASSAGSHSHSNAGSHTHANAGAHTHTVTGTVGSAGSDGAHDNMQPWRAVLYMIKT